MSRRSHLLCGITLIVALTVRFSPMWDAEFVYEDSRIYQGVGNDKSLTDFMPRDLGYLILRPLSQFSWYAQTHSPRLMHLTNLGIHLLAGLFVASLVRRLGGSAPVMWVATSIFLLHPITAEAVNYAASRADLLSAVGVLGACVLALSSFWGLAPWALLLGVLGKETAFIGVLLVMLCVSAKYQWPKWQWNLSLVLNGAVIVAAFWIMAKSRGMASSLEFVGDQAVALFRAIGLVVAPSYQTLNFTYEWVTSDIRVVAVSALVSLGLFAFGSRRSYPLAAFGVLWVLVYMLPRFAVQPQAHGGYLTLHHFYGLFAGVAIGLGSVVRPGADVPPQLFEGEQS